MKIITFKGGLGNQIFEFAFYMYLKEQFKTNIYGYYKKDWLQGHNGLEIQNVFDIELPKASISSNLITFLIRFSKRFFKNNCFLSTDQSLKLESIYFDGWWQNKVYYSHLKDWLEFKKFQLDDLNSDLLKDIKHTESVSIHIRRGDYLESRFIKKYGNICTLDYYKKAIELILKEYKNPAFFIFSDDIEWTKNNLQLINATYISNNTGENSFLDMFLMSHSKANIIANSTFSYWGAYLNKNNPNVIYPKKWFNSGEEAPQIFKDHWIGI